MDTLSLEGNESNDLAAEEHGSMLRCRGALPQSARQKGVYAPRRTLLCCKTGKLVSASTGLIGWPELIHYAISNSASTSQAGLQVQMGHGTIRVHDQIERSCCGPRYRRCCANGFDVQEVYPWLLTTTIHVLNTPGNGRLQRVKCGLDS
jgi:hypothetical protein